MCPDVCAPLVIVATALVEGFEPSSGGAIFFSPHWTQGMENVSCGWDCGDPSATHTSCHDVLPRHRIITGLFPSTVRICSAALGVQPAVPYSDAEAAVVARAIPKRQTEFFVGRACARRALAKIGITAGLIGRRDDRVPVWPAGTVGSISHTEEFCCAIVARASDMISLGIDVERAAELPLSVQRLICQPGEVAELQRLRPPRGCDWVTMAFSAKEAFYKCYYVASGNNLYFHDVAAKFRFFTPTNGEFDVEILNGSKCGVGAPKIVGRWAVDEASVYCGAYIPSEI